MFVDCSHLSRVVLSKWNNQPHSYILMIILICVDVAPNLGPTESYSCGIEVTDSDKALCYVAFVTSGYMFLVILV